MVNKINIKTIGIFLVLFLLGMASVFAATNAQPEGPSLNEVNTSRRTAADASTDEAYAGNITKMTVTGTTVTQSWQGYAGNVSGTITLDDSADNTMYNWSLADPEGEIYATYLDSVDWTTGTVFCWNWSDVMGGDTDSLVLSELEHADSGSGTGVPTSLTTALGANAMGLASDDVDGVDETFDEAGSGTHNSFYVGGQSISANTCPAIKNGGLYNSTGGGNFEEVILLHNSSTFNNKGLIFTSILKSDADGFDGSTWDFEMIVPEDGHDGNTDTTTYYFYVELE